MVVLGLAVLLIFRRLVWGRVLAGGDLHTYFFPYWVAAAHAFQAGRLPLWNPHLFAGAPLLANSQVGVFYPLNWPLWVLAGPSLEGIARALHWSVLLHLLLAAFNAWLLARRLGASPWGAASSGLLYAGSGYLGLHVEHLNQLHALAWLPLTLLPCELRITNYELRIAQGAGRSNSKFLIPNSKFFIPPISIFALALILLAGHTQMAFIAAVGIALWRTWESLARGRSLRGAWPYLWRMAWPYALAFGMAAAQLAPTLALTRYSVRSDGLPWREAVSFSVPPWALPRALLPPYLLPPLLPEGVAYLGLLGLALAGWGAWRALRPEGRALRLPLALAALGLFLALGGYNPLYQVAARLGVPGFAHFRAPARFLALYTLGLSLTAGLVITTENPLARRGAIAPRCQRITGELSLPLKPFFLRSVFLLLALELVWAAEGLPHADATALRAYTALRPATAHLVAATSESGAESPGRFLSISQTLFDVGDGPEIDAIYGDALSADALWMYKVAAKQREVLAPNLSLAFGVPALDGYDGGLLPMQPYVAFSRLLLPEGTRDGRLRENLTAIPDTRWLALAGVRFVITDKVGDAWLDGVFYDRQFRFALEPGESAPLAWLPDGFPADALGLLYTGAGTVTLTFAGGATETLPLALTAGAELAPERVRWAGTGALRGIAFQAGEAGLVVGGVSLLDERAGAFYPLVASAHFRQVHSGDVKIYENLDVLPRAFLVAAATCAPDEATALAWMQAPGFDPAREAVLLDCVGAVLPPGGEVAGSARVTRYEAERVVIEVETVQPALLLFTDAWAPGWTVSVAPPGMAGAAFTPEPLRADLLLRGVLLEPGAWRVTWRYRPEGLAAGAVISAISLLAWALYRREWLRAS